MTQKKCIQCGKTFNCKHGATNCCSTICKLLHKQKYQRERQQAKKDKLNRQYLPYTGTSIKADATQKFCEICGKSFFTTLHHKKYCDRACYNVGKRRKDLERIERNKKMERNNLTGNPKFNTKSLETATEMLRKADSIDKLEAYLTQEIKETGKSENYMSVTQQFKEDEVLTFIIGDKIRFISVKKIIDMIKLLDTLKE